MCSNVCHFPGDFDDSFSTPFSFSAGQQIDTTNYDVTISIMEDDVFEDDEGFILYFQFNENEINPTDFSRLETDTRTILVVITDNDGCKT